MENKEKTTIAISNEVWKALNKLKTARERSFEDVIKRLINEVKQI